jgi:hypothetical protein
MEFDKTEKYLNIFCEICKKEWMFKNPDYYKYNLGYDNKDGWKTAILRDYPHITNYGNNSFGIVCPKCQ